MPNILGANSVTDTGHDVAQSTMLESNSYYSRSASGGSQRTFTLSFWVKRSMLNTGHHQYVYSAYQDANNRISIAFLSTNTFVVFAQDSSGTQLYLQTNKQFKDPSAWMNIVVAVDTTQGTASNRVKLYVNGTQETSFQDETYPDQNEDLITNTTIYIGAYTTSANFFCGYLAEYVYIDGSALAPTSFGEFDSDTPTAWKPKDVSGLTFGTTGFYLNFATRATDPIDASGNSNNFSSSNVLSTDHSIDTCTNNFVTFNPLDVTNLQSVGNISTFSEGNLSVTGNNTSGAGTIGVSQGKWYFEVKNVNGGDNSDGVGFYNIDTSQEVIYRDRAKFRFGSSQSDYGATWQSAGDIIGIVLDLDNTTITFYKNGASQGNAKTDLPAGTYVPLIYNRRVNSTSVLTANFGSPLFSISSGNSDPAGYGNFEYPTNSGYAINTKNLAEYG